jgi:hypothetical protein
MINRARRNTGGMPSLLALLFASSVCGAQPATPVPGYQVHRTLDIHETNSRIELLEDDRLTSATRPLVDSAYARGERPCDTSAPATSALCSEVGRAPLRPAIVRLISATGKELDRLPLERATANLARLAVTRHDSVLAVTVDLSADAGSYSGPVMRFLDVDGTRLRWTQVFDDATGRFSELDLPTTLKTAWRIDAAGERPEILLVACRPDLDHPAANDGSASFVVTYSRFYLVRGKWHKVDRRVAGFWENEGEFPARNSFP